MHNVPDSGDEGLPLTQAEHGIWLGQQLNSGSPFYNAAEAIELHGKLHVSHFEAALQQALQEAPALQRVFRETAQGPRQFWASQHTVYTAKDFSQSADPAALAENWMRNDLAQTVDLNQGPLYQQALIRLTDEHHIWYQRIHHIAADGFAFALLSQRVADLYNSRLEKRDAGKPFGDYAAALNDDQRYQASERREASRQFWINRLEQSPRPVSLSRSMAPIENVPLRITTRLSAENFALLQGFAQALQCNWSDVITAAVVYLVYRNTATQDITLGLPVMGRMGTPALRVPAMIMNIVPLRVDLAKVDRKADTFAQLVKLVADEQRQCRPHHRYRYEHLRRDLNAVGGEKRLYGPVVNIMPFDRQLRFGDATVAVRNPSAGPVEDISFAFVLQPDGSVRFDLDANPGRYTEQQLADYQRELTRILQNIDCQKQLRINPIPFAWLEGGELEKPVLPVVEQFQQQVRERPDAIALIDGEHTLRYRVLDEKARSVAAGLKTHHLQPGDVAALLLPRGEAAVVACLGCLLAGVTYVFLDPRGPQARNQRILEDAAPKLLITEVDTQTDQAFVQVSYASLLSHRAVPAEDIETIPDALAYLIYTSGSTGTPKGVMVGRSALAEFVTGAASAYAIDHKDRVLQYAPLHFDASVEEIFVTLCRSATLVVRSEAMLDSVAAFLKTCEHWQISVLDLPTAYWHELVYFCHATHTQLPHCIHTVIIGGEAALPERVRQWHQLDTTGIRLLNTYGPSETTVVASYARLQADEPVSIGVPLPGRQLAVVDDQGRVLKRGEPGELILLGAGVGSGYLNMPEATASRFRQWRFPWCADNLPAYFTGDKATVTAQGTVEYLGRMDAEIKISGHRINPVEIESAILSLGTVREVAVCVLGEYTEQKTLTAFIVASDDAPELTVQWLRQQLAPLLPAPMLPTRVERVNQLPRSAAGKIDRKTLVESVSPEQQISATQAFLTDEESLIIDIWQQVLGRNGITRDDDFFLLGGQSLQTIQVANRLSATLNRDIPVTLIFEHPRVYQLASALGQAHQKRTAASIREMIEADIALLDLPQVTLQPSRPLQNCETVLLTGATGFVGAQLLYQLLRDTSATVVCLVRAQNLAQAREKIAHALARQYLVMDGLNERVRVVLADLEKLQLGLADAEFSILGENVDAVFHNAAVTSVMRDYNSLRAANLFSTQALLRLAAYKRVPFHLVSTVAVAPASGLPEDFVQWHEGLQDGYQQSKWAAERSAQIASELGYPVNIYRLARVVGDTDTGAINDKDLVWNIIAASVRNGAFPQLALQEPWTPVDAVTHAMVAIAQQPECGGVFNLMPQHTVALSDVFQWLQHGGFNLLSVPLNEWCERLQHSNHEQDLAIRGFFQQRSTATTTTGLPTIASERAQYLLESYNVHLPKITQRHFDTYLKAAIATALIAPPVSHESAQRGIYEPA
jgi:nonribosomal peptide synthetase MxcG